MENFERLHQLHELAGPEQMVPVLGPPPQLALGIEEGLHDEHTARRDAREDVGHPPAVEIVEEEQHVELAKPGPGRLEIDLPELHVETLCRRDVPRYGQLLRIPVHPEHGSPQCRGSQTVPSLAAGEIQRTGTGTDEMSLPVKPGTRARDAGDGAQGQAGHSLRRPALDALGARPVDVLVIGGGITGAGVARDAAMRGLRTVLVEQGDLGSGTSSRSSRLIHGGLRYLEQGHLRLVWEANRERRVLLGIAPHLVRPLPFVFPLHRGDRIPLWRLAAGMWAYDLLALFRNVAPHRMLGKRALLEREPMVRERGLLGGARYFDAQCDDARLVLATARSAAQHGAAVMSYTAVEAFEWAAERVIGVRVTDRLTGSQGTIRASAVVNATGPWVDRLRTLEEPGCRPLIRTTKGVHVVVPRDRLGHHEAIAFLSPIDGRVMFALPWGELSYVGTTDTDALEPPEAATATADDVVYLLRSVNARFPNARLGLDDIRGTWAGLRPLLAPEHDGRPSNRSREHAIVTGAGGIITIAGGKLTTYRVMAAQTVDRVLTELAKRGVSVRSGEARTDEEPLPGGETAALEPFRERALEIGLAAETADHLVRHYGTESAGIVNFAAIHRAYQRRLHPDHPAIEAEVLHMVRRELASRVEDVLVRRIHLHFETRDRGAAAAARVAELMAEELGWSGDRTAAELEAYRRLSGSLTDTSYASAQATWGSASSSASTRLNESDEIG
jgi:glycerol-3-phosphate dehydrogenase